MRTIQRRTALTPAQSANALAAVQTLYEMTPREKAEAWFERAKAEFDEATRALMNNDPGSIERADAALEILTDARAALLLLHTDGQP